MKKIRLIFLYVLVIMLAFNLSNVSLLNVLASESCIANEYGSYTFEDGNNVFDGGEINSDPTAEKYGYTSRAENSIYNALSYNSDSDTYDTSNKNFTLSSAVSTGVLVIEAEIFADYYNGTSDDEYSADDPRGNSQIGGFSIDVYGTYGDSGKRTRISKLARSGNITSQNGGWGSTIFDKHCWYDVKYIINLDTETLTGFYGKCGETMNPVVFQSASLKSDGTAYQQNSEKYLYDGLACGSNNNGYLPDSINNIMITSINAKLDNWIDNLHITVYKPLYRAINDASDAEDVRACFETYADVYQLDMSKAGNVDLSQLYTDMLNSQTQYSSYAQIQSELDSYLESFSKAEMTAPHIYDNNLICGYGDITVSDFINSCRFSAGAKVEAYDYDGASKVDLNETAREGIKIKVTASNGTTSQVYCLGYAKYAEFAPIVSFESDEDEYFNVSYTVKSYVDTPVRYNVYAAQYIDNQLVKISKESLDVTSAGTYTQIAAIKTDSLDGATYKAFVFTDNLRPVKKSTQVSQTLSGKNILCLGDSITGNALTGYPGYIENLTGAKCYNCGIGSTAASYASSGINRYLSLCSIAEFLTDDNFDYTETDAWVETNVTDISRLTHYDTLKSIDISSIDYITMLYGTNDYYGCKKLDNSDNKYDKTTVKGSFRYTFEKLLEANPELKIIVATPFYRDRLVKSDTEDGLNSDDYPNSSGMYLYEYTKAIEDVCAEYGIDVYNLYENSDITRFNEYYYLSDGLHPNSVGLRYLGAQFAQMLLRTMNDTNEFKVDSAFYPGWTKKAVTFTLDDANATADQAVIDVLRPAGMKATFNLISNALDVSTEEKKQTVIERYEGFEIANHTKYHAYPYHKYTAESEETGYDENGNPVQLYIKEGGGYIAEEEELIICANAGHAELERIFGEGSVVGFVWPGGGWGEYSTYKSEIDSKYDMTRLAYLSKSEDFSLPSSWIGWNYNADHTNIYSRALEYDALNPEIDDELTWFCAGVHSSDYRKSANIEAYDSWNGFLNTVDLFKNRADTYWYAGNREIYDYTMALDKLEITGSSVTNKSDITLYIKLNGRRVTLAPGQKIGQ